MEQEKISIITSVYKIGQYLEKAVQSIVAQTYKNLEIILVDDGSPDECPKLCDDLAQKYSRIKVIHKPNGGVSSAWNAGLDNATGEYISFVDGDDWVEPTYIEEMYKAIKKYNCDIAICATNIIRNGKVTLDNHLAEDKFVPKKECYNLFFAPKECRHTSWGKLYKREIFDYLRYPEDISCVEDSYLITYICDNVKVGIVTISSKLYNYVIRNSSVTRTIKRNRLDWIKAKKHNCEKIDCHLPCYKYCCSQLFGAYGYLHIEFKVNNLKDLRKELYAMYKKDYKKYAKYLTPKKRLWAFLFRYFRWVLDIKNRKSLKQQTTVMEPR